MPVTCTILDKFCNECITVTKKNIIVKTSFGHSVESVYILTSYETCNYL